MGFAIPPTQRHPEDIYAVRHELYSVAPAVLRARQRNMQAVVPYVCGVFCGYNGVGASWLPSVFDKVILPVIAYLNFAGWLYKIALVLEV